jgi:hypothetical protein
MAQHDMPDTAVQLGPRESASTYFASIVNV